MKIPAIALAAALFVHLPGAARAETAASLAAEAADLVNAGRHKEAVAKLKKAVRREPENASLHLSLGLTYQSLSRFKKAIRSIKKAVKLSPESPKAYYSLALLHEAVALRGVAAEDPEASRIKHLRLALKAWNEYIRLEKDPEKLEVARKHREDITDRLAP